MNLLENSTIQHIIGDVTESLKLAHKLGLRLSVLIELGLTLSSEHDQEKLVDLFCHAVQDVMSARYTAVWLTTAKGRVTSHASRGFTDAAQIELTTLSGKLADVLATAMPLRKELNADNFHELGLPASHPPVQTMMAVPIKSATKTYGVLYLADNLGSTSYDIDDERIAITIAAQFTLAHENLNLFEAARQNAGQLEESETRFRQLAESIREVFFLMDGRYTQMLYVSPAYEEVWGLSCESLYAQPRSWVDLVHPDDVEAVHKSNAERDVLGWSNFDYEYRIVRPDGDMRWIHARGFPVLNDAGELIRVAGIAEDITGIKEQLQRVARLSRISSVLSSINSAIVHIHDRSELFQEACRIAVDKGTFSMAWIGEIDAETLEGKVVAWAGGKSSYIDKVRLTARPGTPYSDRPACVAVREMRPVICNDIRLEPALEGLRADLLKRGNLSVAAFPLKLDNRADAVIVLYANEAGIFDEEELRLLNELAGDLSFGLQYIEKEEKLSYMAYYDLLTGLPNGRLFNDRLTQYLRSAKNDSIIAVIIVDLVYFSQLNEVLGRHVGDILLQQVAERFEAALREPYTLARIGGNTFAIAVADLRHEADAASILDKRIFESLKRPFIWNKQEIRISARGGVSLSPVDGVDAETLYKHAEIALRKAKASGEHYFYYSSQMNLAIASRMVLENELITALGAGQFLVYYQPRVDLLSGRIIGAEALIRWQHPQRGIVSPAEFIPLAEESGIIVPIGAWVIDAVCSQQVAWQAQQVEIVPVAVNLSSVQFKRGGVLQTIRSTINKHQLKHQYIEFELTESVVMDNPDDAVIKLQALKKLGVKLSLDDFGTGYSSLSYLKRFPFDFVKIDRAFVTDITTSQEDAALANAIIAMAHGLNLRVVAEGVETEEQVNYLRKQGCDELQGYYFSPPVPAESFAAMLREGKHLVFTEKLLKKAIS